MGEGCGVGFGVEPVEVDAVAVWEGGCGAAA